VDVVVDAERPAERPQIGIPILLDKAQYVHNKLQGYENTIK